jgi:23S rRNA (uracil1939-C5)-methyltransferase
MERVQIERLVAGGDALARMSDGRVAFVDGALPGETVDIEVVQSKKDFVKARLIAVVDSSKDRVVPPCPHVADGCGGCSWQHLSPAKHMSAKLEIVRESLRRVAKLGDIDVCEGGSVPIDHARTTLRMAVMPSGRLGFRRAQSNEVIGIESCLVAHPLLQEIITDARVSGASEATLRCGAESGDRGVWLHDERGRNVKTAVIEGIADDVQVGRRSIIRETVHGVTLEVSMSSFFQSSPQAAELIVSAVNDAAGDAALSGEDGPIIDAYGGCGLFAATLVDLDVPVTLVESNKSACADARRNLRDHRVRIEEIAFEQWQPSRAGLVIADPARSGLGKTGVSTIVGTRAKTVVLVSCDAVAGARDIALLVEAGYACTGVTVLDVFPYTHHVEMVSRFTLES